MFSEGKTIEFKRQYVDDIKNTVTAFANCDGGTLYIGIDDDGSVCGVDNADDIMLRVTSAVRDAVRPDITMFTECRSEIMDDKTVYAFLCSAEQRDRITFTAKAFVPKAFMCGRVLRRYRRPKRRYSQ